MVAYFNFGSCEAGTAKYTGGKANQQQPHLFMATLNSVYV
jgi:hypothetical protein